MEKISVVINTLNEEKNLPRVLSSISSFADEIVVVDMMSDDRSRSIAEKFGAKVYKHEKMGYVEPARNFAISKAKGSWILILDADEKIGSDLKEILKEISKNPTGDYFRLPRKNIIFGKWIKYSRFWPDFNIRFFKKGHVTWNEVIHSVPMTKGKGVDLEASEKNAIVHFHYNSIEQFIDRLNRYTSEHAKNMVMEGYKFDWKDLINKPSSEFLSRFFQGQGYKDGVHGLALAGLQGFSELVKYLKIWQLNKFESHDMPIRKVIEEMKNSESDLHYWQADTLHNEFGGIKNRIKRKFKL